MVDRIERILRKSRGMGKVRPLDPSRPDLLARATRLSTLYDSSLNSELARTGAGEKPRHQKRKQPRYALCKENRLGTVYAFFEVTTC